MGNVGIGGDNPIRVQPMITCDTMDTALSVQQTLELVAVGCQIVRITAPTASRVIALRCDVGDLVVDGAELVVLEALA